MTIRLDASTSSGVLVTCTDCPQWHAFHWTRADAWAAGARHQQQTHARNAATELNAAASDRYRHRDTPPLM